MGGDVNIIGEPLYYEIFKFFHIIFLPTLKILLSLVWVVKNVLGPLDEDSPNVAPEISHSLFIFLLCLPILKVSCV